MREPMGNLGVGFWYSTEDGFDETGWSVELETDDFDEVIGDLFDARNSAAEGDELWQGAQLMLLVTRGGQVSWELMDDGSRVE